MRIVVAKIRCKTKHVTGITRCTRKRGHQGKHYGEWRGGPTGVSGWSRIHWK